MKRLVEFPTEGGEAILAEAEDWRRQARQHGAACLRLNSAYREALGENRGLLYTSSTPTRRYPVL